MYGLELQQARMVKREELRRAARASLRMTGGALALDDDDLLYAASPNDQGWRGLAVKRALAIRGLAQLSYTDDDMARAWGVPLQLVRDWRTAELVDKTGVAAAIDEQVAAELPETPEPGRLVAVDERVFPTDARGAGLPPA